MNEALTRQQVCNLRGMAQRLDTHLKVGKNGLSESFLKTVSETLDQHELIKVKFADLKEQKHELAPELAARSNSVLVTLIGNVAVLYRAASDPSKRKIEI